MIGRQDQISWAIGRKYRHNVSSQHDSRGATIEPVNLTAMLKKGAASEARTFALTLPHRESLIHVWTQYFQGSAMPTTRQRYAMAYGGDNACVSFFWMACRSVL